MPIIRFRRGTAAQAAGSATILESGEPAIETDTRKLRIGDGVTATEDLPAYLDETGLSASIDEIATPIVNGSVGAAQASNVRPTNLLRFRSAVAGVRGGTASADVKVLVVGDSTSWGVGGAGVGTSPPLESWSAKTTANLRAAGLESYIGLAVPPYGGAATDNRWAIGTGWTGGFSNGFGNDARFIGTAGGAGVLKFTPGQNAGPVDRFDVYYLAANANIDFTLTTEDGTTQTFASGSLNGVGKVTITSTKTTLTNWVTVSVGGSNNMSVIGVEPSLSTRRRVRVGNAGVGGTSTTGWNTTGIFGALSSIAAYAPNLTLISLGLNDTASGGTVAAVKATHKTNMSAIIAKAQLSGEVILVTPNPMFDDGTGTGQAAKLRACVEAQYELAEQYAIPIVDIQGRLVSYSVANAAGMFSDTLHPSDKGYVDWASAITGTLLAIFGTSPTPTEEVRMPAPTLGATEGTPSLSPVVTYMPTWALDKNTNEAIATATRVPRDWKTFDIAVRGCTLAASPGTVVVLRGAWGRIALGESTGNVDSTNTVSAGSAGQYVLQDIVLATGIVNRTVDCTTWIQIQRRASDVADTLDSDYGIVELILRRRT